MLCLRQTRQQEGFEPAAKRGDADRFDHIVREGMHQQLPGQSLSDAARAQIKQLRFVELADGRAVVALDVVGVNFELRLGVDFRIFGQQQVVVGLVGIGLLRARMHDDLAVEHRVGLTVHHSAIVFPAGAVGLAMINERVVVHMLLAADQIQAVERGLAATGVERGRDVVAAQGGAQREGVG